MATNFLQITPLMATAVVHLIWKHSQIHQRIRKMKTIKTMATSLRLWRTNSSKKYTSLWKILKTVILKGMVPLRGPSSPPSTNLDHHLSRKFNLHRLRRNETISALARYMNQTKTVGVLVVIHHTGRTPQTVATLMLMETHLAMMKTFCRTRLPRQVAALALASLVAVLINQKSLLLLMKMKCVQILFKSHRAYLDRNPTAKFAWRSLRATITVAWQTSKTMV